MSRFSTVPGSTPASGAGTPRSTPSRIQERASRPVDWRPPWVTTSQPPAGWRRASTESTAHWLPIANGYAPYVPETFTRIMDAAGKLPDPAALDAMLAVAPLRWLVVNRSSIDDAAGPAWQATFADAGLTVAGDFGDMVVFEVPPARR